jgi:glycine/D-amino acid oxidase-like deaminating enzyme
MSTNTFAPESAHLKLKGWNGLDKKASIIVIGAGAFGGWTALWLRRAGFAVTLVDAWGPGNSRSSSGDETRVIRSTYGANEFYFDLNVRALELWKQHQTKWNRQIFYNTGVLWMCYEQSAPIVDDSIPFARKHQMEYQWLSKEDLRRKYPTINSSDLDHAWLDPFGGYLKARESTQLVAETFMSEGGVFLQAYVDPGKTGNQPKAGNEHLKADYYIYACGAWLGRLFPDVLGKDITCSKQEVYYFGTPVAAGKVYDEMPVWVDVDGKDFYYGIPGNLNRGFKIGVDRRGKPFDPTTGERLPEAEVLRHARSFVAHRFPGLKDAPVVESRVCPYENSPDGNFIFQQHPEASNVFFIGGGSGHGFKHGPAWGEYVTRTLVGGDSSVGSRQ